MKKLLLTAIMGLSALALNAQSKTTGVVTLTTGMTAKMDLNSATSTVTLTFTGPSDRWFALQFGSFSGSQGMMSGADMVYSNGTTLVDCVMNGWGNTPSTDANNWTVSSNTVSGTTRTIVATRGFVGGSGDYTFNYSDTDIDFVWAKSQSVSNSLTSGHGGFRGYKINNVFTCMPPDAPTASAQSFCSGATVANLTANGGAGATFSWYTSATGGSALAGTSALSNATYYVSQTLSACESTRTPVSVTITTVNQPVAAAAQTFCTSGTVANLAATASGGATVHWYEAATGGSALAGTTALANGSTYYAGQTLGDCSSTRVAVTVTITNVSQPTAPEAQTFCNGATVANLAATASGGATLHWYAAATGGSALAGTTALTNGTTYYAGQSIGDCSSTRKAVTVTVNTTPAPTAAAQAFCSGAIVYELTATTADGAVIAWYSTIGGEPLSSETELQNGTYFVTQTLNECESAPASVAVTITQTPAAPTGSETQLFTAGETVADLDVTAPEGTQLHWFIFDEDVYVPIETSTALVDGTTYYVNAQAGNCIGEFLAVTVTFTAGTESFSLEGLKAYPNPTRDVLTIAGKAPLSGVSIINMLGQQVLYQTVSGTEAQLNIAQLTAGSYIVKVTAANGATASVKIAKY